MVANLELFLFLLMPLEEKQFHISYRNAILGAFDGSILATHIIYQKDCVA